MQRIWSPWRSQHLDSLRSPEPEADEAASLFVRLADGDRDEENLIVFRGSHVFVVMNLYPYNNGHVLIVPYRQVESYTELSPDERDEMSSVLQRCIGWLQSAVEPDGFNVGMNIGKAAGAGIPEHLHMHVVPRWRGDTNFMPTVADVKVVPESMQETYRKLKRAVEASR